MNTQAQTRTEQMPKSKHVDEGERIMMQTVSPLSMIFEQQLGKGDSTKSLPLKFANGMGSSNNILNASTSKGGKKTSIMGEKRGKGKMSSFFSTKKKSNAAFTEVSDATRNVFGVTLEKAITASRITDSFELPAVIYRCIEYLEGKDG
jgi:hypothetical protein